MFAPRQWPDAMFDLILLSEVVYYLARDGRRPARREGEALPSSRRGCRSCPLDRPDRLSPQRRRGCLPLRRADGTGMRRRPFGAPFPVSSRCAVARLNGPFGGGEENGARSRSVQASRPVSTVAERTAGFFLRWRSMPRQMRTCRRSPRPAAPGFRALAPIPRSNARRPAPCSLRNRPRHSARSNAVRKGSKASSQSASGVRTPDPERIGHAAGRAPLRAAGRGHVNRGAISDPRILPRKQGDQRLVLAEGDAGRRPARR